MTAGAPVVVSVDEAGQGQRLDRFLAARFPEHSRARLQALIEAGDVRLDDLPTRASARLRAGQTVELRFSAPTPAEPGPEDIPLQVVYEDAQLLVIDKPAGLVVHPGAGVHTGTLVNALLHHVQDLSGVGGVLRPGIVHRLDRGTSGLIVVAKDDASHRALARQFASRKVEKDYLAIVLGLPAQRAGRIDKPIGRDPVHRLRMSVRAPRGRAAVSDYTVVEVFEGAALVRVRIHTGRTHQIRVHLASLGHPLAGDRLYGGKRPAAGRGAAALAAFERPALHAARLAFQHPLRDELLRFESPLPLDLRELLAALRGAGQP